ncbi:Uncharacterised protein [Parabacteroides distasonis]|uniref:Uncharacterized protein n=1 Tax=Parabacteroides distasonis TaxID=823 RepID=A0A8D9LE39_PARDI|nr:Uncharacterised protein [Parabacteroides distasonis]
MITGIDTVSFTLRMILTYVSRILSKSSVSSVSMKNTFNSKASAPANSIWRAKSIQASAL